MRRCSAVILLMCSQAVAAASQSRDSTQPPEYYKPMAFLVGSCWVGTFPDGKATDEKCFEWIFDRKFIRERHVVRGASEPYAGETIFAWDPKQKRIVFTYLNTLGGISTGTGEFGAEGIAFPETHTTDKGPVEMKAIWKPIGADRFTIWQAQKTGNEWRTLWTMELRRVPPRP